MENNTATEKTPAPEAGAINLSIADLAAAVQIIDFAAARGAFTGDNLAKVGTIRDRLAQVVEAVAPAQAQVDGEVAEGDDA